MVLINGVFEVYYAISFAQIKRGVEVINTSAGYKFLMILPLLLYRYKKYNIWVFVLTLILTMMTGKRGALVIYIVLTLYGIYNYKWIAKTFKLDWKVIVFLSLVVIGYLFFMESAYQSLEHRLLTLEDSKRGSIGSGRNIIWGTLVMAWYNADLIPFYFGHGFYATSAIEGHIAHNDFIEFLVDMGVFVLLLYSAILFMFYKNIKRFKTRNHYLYMLLLFCLFIWCGRAFIAGTIRTDQIILSISMGYLLAIQTKQRLYGQ